MRWPGVPGLGLFKQFGRFPTNGESRTDTDVGGPSAGVTPPRRISAMAQCRIYMSPDVTMIDATSMC
jgi:hypothetical protein